MTLGRLRRAALTLAVLLVLAGGSLLCFAPLSQASFRPQGSFSLQQEQAERQAKLDLNTATLEQLCRLKGIGEKKARAILTYRGLHGGFRSVQDLAKVSGISQAMVESWQDQLTVSQAGGTS